MEWERVDMRIPPTPESAKEYQSNTENMFHLNHSMPHSPEYLEAMHALFPDMGANSWVNAPLSGVCFSNVNIGKNVYINSNCLMMARGGITIEDNVQIAANAQLITNNHDPYDRMILTCKPVHIKKGAWIGAGATILPGVTIGKHAIVGAASVVTKDVPDYAVAVGNPAKIVKSLDADKFPTD